MSTSPFLPTAPRIECALCYYEGWPSSVRTFPCGCVLPIHDMCVISFKQRGGICPICGSLWTFTNGIPFTPPLVIRKNECPFWTICFIFFITVAVFSVVGTIVYLTIHAA